MDPLAQLQDIHLPEQVHNYPIALGWWIVLVLIIIAIIFSVRFYLRYRQIRKVKKQIIAKVQTSTSVDETLILLKIAMMNYFSRKETASLHTTPLHNFMLSQLKTDKAKHFNELMLDSLAQCYQAESTVVIKQFNQAISFWLSHALPPALNNHRGGRND